MRKAYNKGFSFGVISGVITTVGLMMGLDSVTADANSSIAKLAVIGGILSIAIADAFSDAIAMHISQESDRANSVKEIWQSTFSTFLAKLFVALTFLVPILLMPLRTAIIVNIIWAFVLVIAFNYRLAKQRGEKVYSVIGEHVTIMLVVLILTYYAGKIIAYYFGA